MYQKFISRLLICTSLISIVSCRLMTSRVSGARPLHLYEYTDTNYKLGAHCELLLILIDNRYLIHLHTVSSVICCPCDSLRRLSCSVRDRYYNLVSAVGVFTITKGFLEHLTTMELVRSVIQLSHFIV